MPTVKFDKVSLSAARVETKNGKNKTVKKEFYQTVSPFNRNKDGSRKTRDQIWSEIKAESEAWMKEKV